MSYTTFKYPTYSRDHNRICTECGRPAKEHWMYGDSVFGEFRCPEVFTIAEYPISTVVNTDEVE